MPYFRARKLSHILSVYHEKSVAFHPCDTKHECTAEDGREAVHACVVTCYNCHGAECRRMTAAVDAGTALRRALDQQLQQANSQAMKQEAQIKVALRAALVHPSACRDTCRRAV